MLIHLHVIRSKNTEEIKEDIWVNPDMISRIEPVLNTSSMAESWLYFRDDYNWRTIAVYETPYEITLMTNMLGTHPSSHLPSQSELNKVRELYFSERSDKNDQK